MNRAKGETWDSIATDACALYGQSSGAIGRWERNDEGQKPDHMWRWPGQKVKVLISILCSSRSGSQLLDVYRAQGQAAIVSHERNIQMPNSSSVLPKIGRL